MICGHCSQKHDAVRDVARCAWIAHAKSEKGVSPQFKAMIAKRFPASKEESAA